MLSAFKFQLNKIAYFQYKVRLCSEQCTSEIYLISPCCCPWQLLSNYRVQKMLVTRHPSSSQLTILATSDSSHMLVNFDVHNVDWFLARYQLTSNLFVGKLKQLQLQWRTRDEKEEDARDSAWILQRVTRQPWHSRSVQFPWSERSEAKGVPIPLSGMSLTKMQDLKEVLSDSEPTIVIVT